MVAGGPAAETRTHRALPPRGARTPCARRPATPLTAREQTTLDEIEDGLIGDDRRLGDEMAGLDGFASAPLPPVARWIVAIAIGVVALAVAAVLPPAGWALVALVVVVVVVWWLLRRAGTGGPGG